MGRFIIRRILGSIVTFFVILTLSFFMVKLAPGGPFSRERAFPPEVLKKLEEKYDLDKPIYTQYWLYMKRVVFEFDLGPSTRYADRSVNELIATKVRYSMTLGFGAMVFALLLGITAGLTASLNHNKFLDYAPMGMAMVGVSVPDFVMAYILMIIFGLSLNWLPVAGVESWQGYVLPCITLGFVYAASISRLTRGGMLEILGQDFIRTAKAKGLPKHVILLRHSLRGGLLPLVSYLGPASAGILTGSIVVEEIFLIPGIGKLLIESATNRDYTLALGCVIVFALLILVFNMVVDLVYGFLDPRVKYE
ncbi:MAG: ABC transporter [Deltaproteobacteria bacterium CG11_big_fil_rev_8_21_14_0_20_45_16]|nr:MAG: ABC transporter [Deltaproteobacteria bacterium CG11_big_fil_rev_8_21_14_0_20_45_16]